MSSTSKITLAGLQRALTRLWDKITTALAGKADAADVTTALAGKADAGDAAPPAFLWMTEKDLYIICRQGFIRPDDRITFARYVSTKDAVKVGSDRARIRKRGWKTPTWYDVSPEDGSVLTKPLFTLYKTQVNPSDMDITPEGSADTIRQLPRFLTSDLHDYWRIGVNEGADDNRFAVELMDANRGSLFADPDRKATEQGGIRLHAMRLGVRVERRKGAGYPYTPVTDRMPFSVVWDKDIGEPFMARRT